MTLFEIQTTKIHRNLIPSGSSLFQEEKMHDLVGNCLFGLDFRPENQSGIIFVVFCCTTFEKEYFDIPPITTKRLQLSKDPGKLALDALNDNQTRYKTTEA
ncbi:hypothetical protein K0M31_018186 [Melipona bicolor]|uniref:Uncharacterized protein n=1 Tax=Melipona bicolor TaxID=60889 RepID=A0AA40KDT2_9HYME|nr:hypothetical protein K0M31_018186 [Melipona bicolor]